jgi:hypothetical protein
MRRQEGMDEGIADKRNGERHVNAQCNQQGKGAAPEDSTRQGDFRRRSQLAGVERAEGRQVVCHAQAPIYPPGQEKR